MSAYTYDMFAYTCRLASPGMPFRQEYQTCFERASGMKIHQWGDAAPSGLSLHSRGSEKIERCPKTQVFFGEVLEIFIHTADFAGVYPLVI